MNRLKKLHRVFAGASFAAALVVVGYSTPSNAQTATGGSVFNDSSVNPERSGGFFDNGATGSPTRGITDMIHNAILGPKISIEDFSVQQNDNLNAETNEFLKRRQEQLKRQSGGSNSLRPVIITPDSSVGGSQSAADALKLTPAPAASTEAPAKN